MTTTPIIYVILDSWSVLFFLLVFYFELEYKYGRSVFPEKYLHRVFCFIFASQLTPSLNSCPLTISEQNVRVKLFWKEINRLLAVIFKELVQILTEQKKSQKIKLTDEQETSNF